MAIILLHRVMIPERFRTIWGIRIIQKSFRENELKILLCEKLSLNYDIIKEGDNYQEIIFNLIQYFENRNEKKESNNAEAWFELGLANERLKDLTAAETAYRRSIMLDDQNTDALLRLGFIAKSKDDKKEIKAIQEKISKINPDLLEDYYKLVGCSKTCE